MKDFYWESDRKYFKVPYQVILDKVKKLCKEYGIVTDPEEMLDCGMKELFDENGNVLEDYAKEKLEYGKKACIFGDIGFERHWARDLVVFKMKDFVSKELREYFKVPYLVIREKVSAICKEYGIVTDVDIMTNYGMHELFDENGNLLEDYAKYKLEKGKELGMFGDIVSEGTWASHLGD